MAAQAKILVLDDDVSFLDKVRGMLNNLAYETALLSSSKYLFQRLETETFDAILMDIHLQETDGVSLLKQLKNAPAYQHIPVIMLTLDTDEHLLKQCFDQGASDFVHKPVKAITLQTRLAAALNLQKTILALHQEIERRRQVEEDLCVAQRRLAKILDFMDEAIISFDRAHKIIFCNQVTERILGYSAEELLGQSAELLLPLKTLQGLELVDVGETATPLLPATRPPTEIRMRRKQQPEMLVEATSLRLLSEDEMTLVLLFHEKTTPVPFPIASSADLVQRVGQEQQKMQALGEAVEGMLQLFMQGGQQLLQELHGVKSSLSDMSEFLSEEHQSICVRETLVKVMVSAVEYWEKATGKTKIALAEESGLWRIHLDRDSYYAKTLTRYLQLQTLPKYPRWKNVIDTAHYVLRHCAPLQPFQAELEAAVKTLKHLLQKQPK